MADEGLRDTVRALRDDGRSPKQIAKSLGLPREQVLALMQEGGSPDEADPDIVGCWLSPGWSVGLTVDERFRGRRGWSDPHAEAERAGIASVLLARDDRRGGKVSVCGYLVDVYCLGVKNALGPETMSRRALHEFRQRYFALWDLPPYSVPLALAQHLVLGARDFAQSLGFEPHADFGPAAAHLGPWEGPSAITFGRDGKPTYAVGPYDDQRAVVKKLERSVGKGNFELTIESPVG